MRPWRWVVLLLVSVGVPLLVVWQPWQKRLHVIEQGGKGPPDLMLLHGYGSSAEHWLPYVRTIPLPSQGRFLFPQGPGTIDRGDGGIEGGAARAWWDLDLAAHLRPGKPGVDLRQEEPHGLELAGRLVRRAMGRAGVSRKRPFILGGFSQGAIVACEVAFTTDVPLAALVVLSGTPIDTTGWRENMSRRKGLPVFMSHGRADDVLPYDLADGLRADMVAAGLVVTFLPFDGGHEIPGEVVAGLGRFLAGIKI
jgi:phospholipase/carboxylesterase